MILFILIVAVIWTLYCFIPTWSFIENSTKDSPTTEKEYKKSHKFGLFGLLIGLGSLSYLFAAIEKYGGISNVMALACLAMIICGWVGYFIGWMNDPGKKLEQRKSRKQTHPFDAIYTEKYDPSSGASLTDKSKDDLATFFNKSVEEEIIKEKNKNEQRKTIEKSGERILETAKQDFSEALKKINFPEGYSYKISSYFSSMFPTESTVTLEFYADPNEEIYSSYNHHSLLDVDFKITCHFLGKKERYSLWKLIIDPKLSINQQKQIKYIDSRKIEDGLRIVFEELTKRIAKHQIFITNQRKEIEED